MALAVISFHLFSPIIIHEVNSCTQALKSVNLPPHLRPRSIRERMAVIRRRGHHFRIHGTMYLDVPVLTVILRKERR